MCLPVVGGDEEAALICAVIQLWVHAEHDSLKPWVLEISTACRVSLLPRRPPSVTPTGLCGDRSKNLFGLPDLLILQVIV